MKKILCIPDLHVRKARLGLPPGEDKRSLAAVLAYAEKRAPYDEVIQLGDFWDIPYWRVASELKKLKKDTTLLRDSLRWYEQDLAIGVEWLKRFKQLGKKLVILEGNHDYRYLSLLEHMPHLEGRIPSPKQIVEDNKALWVPTWSKQGAVYTVRNLNFVHGIYARQGTSARLTAHKKFVGENVFFGHTHWEEMFSPETRHQERQYVSMSCGCLCRYDQPYLKHMTTNWQQMFVEIFSRDRKNFSFYNYRLFNHKFVGPDGKEWKG